MVSHARWGSVGKLIDSAYIVRCVYHGICFCSSVFESCVFVRSTIYALVARDSSRWHRNLDLRKSFEEAIAHTILSFSEKCRVDL